MSDKRTLQLRTWMWRAFVQSALIPLLLVETVLIAVYLFSNGAIRDAQINYLRENARADLQASAQLEARVIDGELAAIDRQTKLYRNMTATALLNASPAAEPSNLAINDAGVRFSPRDEGGSAVFYSSVTAPEKQDLGKVARLGGLDPLMKQIKDGNNLIAALYFNSWDSLNYIYPWFLTPEQYAADMPIPDFNFYYLADAKHNPSRGVVWTDVYLDPAGQGWMMSAIGPVYRGDFLEGVVGIDVTVGNILTQIGELKVPWNGYAMLVSKDLNIMAMPKPGEEDFGLTELTTHSYSEAIRRELYKPEDFNLSKRAETQGLAEAMRKAPKGIMALPLNGKNHLVAWTTISETGWQLLTVVDESDVFKQTNTLANRFKQIGYLLIAGLVFFYAVFFTFMWLRSRSLSDRLQKPIAGISNMLDQIGSGKWQPPKVDSEISELDLMSGHALAMGSRLGHSESERMAVQKRLELVLEGTTESIWEHDLRTNQINLRGRFAQRFGLSSETISEDEFRAHGHPDDIERVLAAKQEAVDGKQEYYSTEYRFADAAGIYHWLLSRGRVLERDPVTGQAVLLGGTHQDIDALKKTETELREASIEAQAASVAKSRFISSMTHELRTPLNAIQGFAQLMRMQRPPDIDAGEPDYLDEIISASNHLNQLVGDILDWSSAQADKQVLDLQSVNVRDVMLECVELARIEVEGAGLVFNIDLPEQDFHVAADQRRLRQVILNLISNAIKYNTPGGQITLSYELQEGRVRMIVEDTGMGISSELQSQLFQPFQRLGRENTAILGTGIGLSLCREFAQMMGGTMGVRSHTGVGSTFWIELPLNQDRQAEAVGQSAGTGTRPRIVFVEDSPVSQFLVINALGDIADVEVIADGKVAMSRILATPPALLLLDINLPGLSGEDVLRVLRADSRTRHLKVIVLSSADSAGRMLDLDCQGYLAKPIDVDELRGLIGAMLA